MIIFFQAEDGIRDTSVTGVQTCALPISMPPPAPLSVPAAALAPVTGASAQLESIARRYWTALLDTAPLQLLGNGALGGPLFATALGDHRFGEIGRASCRERVWSGVGGVW